MTWPKVHGENEYNGMAWLLRHCTSCQYCRWCTGYHCERTDWRRVHGMIGEPGYGGGTDAPSDP